MEKTIPYHEIQKIEIANQTDATAIINGKYGEEVKLRNQLDLKAFNKRKQINEIIKYASVPIIFSSLSGKIKIVSHNVIVNSNFILIQTVDGQILLISPIKMEEFVAEVQKRMQ